MKNSFSPTRLTLLALALVFFPSLVQAELSLSLNSQVHIQADTIQFLRDQNLVICKGNVSIQQDQVHLYADSIRYDNVAQDVYAEGHVVWQDESQEVECQSLNYNLKTGTGKAYNIKTTAPPWISTGSEIDILPHKIVIKDAITTTCDYPDGYQHYYMKCDKITIYSGDYLVAENVVFFIGKVPVFYFPFFVRTIHDVQTPLSVETGSTDYLGDYILLTNSYLLNPKSYGALYTDYFFKKGFGLGIRHELALNDYQVLSLYFYGIKEKDDGLFRWEGRARMLWALSSNFQGRVEADVPGDGNFSNDYAVARRDPSLVSTVREYDFSTTYTNQAYTLGLLLRRQEIANVNNPDIINPNSSSPVTFYDNFIRSLQNLPQINFSLFPQTLLFKSGPKYDLSLNGDHTYTQANGFYVSHLTGDVGLSQTLSLLQTQSLFGRVEWDEAWQDVADQGVTVGPGSAGETHSVDIQSTWMSRWSEYLNTNFTYNYTQKLNNLYPTDPPHGVTANFLSGTMECDIGSSLRENTSSSFDFQEQVGKDAYRFGYLHQEFYWTASPQFNYTLIGDYSMGTNGLKDLNSILNLQSPKDLWLFRTSINYVNPNFTNQGPVTYGEQSTFELAGELDFAFFTNYRLSFIESYDLSNSQFETRSINLYRDLHDWEAEIQYTEDPVQGKQFFFTLNLKAFPGRPLTVSQNELQSMSSLRNQGLTGAASQFQ